jgi:hypothetical protein
MPLIKVISGLQTGVDVGAVMAAKTYGYETGGWMPAGFLTEEGPRPEYAGFFGAREHTSPKYPPRTRCNIRDSDGTLMLAWKGEPGTRLTYNLAGKLGRPNLLLSTGDPFWKAPEGIEILVNQVRKFILDNHLSTLNVAGNRESKCPGIRDWTYSIMCEVFHRLRG